MGGGRREQSTRVVSGVEASHATPRVLFLLSLSSRRDNPRLAFVLQARARQTSFLVEPASHHVDDGKVRSTRTRLAEGETAHTHPLPPHYDPHVPESTFPLLPAPPSDAPPSTPGRNGTRHDEEETTRTPCKRQRCDAGDADPHPAPRHLQKEEEERLWEQIEAMDRMRECEQTLAHDRYKATRKVYCTVGEPADASSSPCDRMSLTVEVLSEHTRRYCD